MPQQYDFLAGVQSGQNWIDGMFQQRAQRQAGRAVASGDYQGGSNTLLRSGDLEGGLGLRSRGQAEQAANQTRVTADQARLAAFTLQAAKTLKAVPPEQRAQTYAEMTPTLRLLGQSDQDIQAFGQGLQTNPALIDQAEQWAGQTVKEWEFRDGGAGDVVAVRQGANGTPESQLIYDAPDRPISTPYGIILPPQPGSRPGQGNAQPQATGASISSDPLWSRQVQQESGGRQFGENGQPLTSPKGAFGVAQLMPGTAQDMARQMGVTVEQLKNDPALNEAAGQRYQQQQLDKYGGNTALALAAYNAGPGKVDEWIQRFGDPRTGEITTEEFVARIPYAETKNYVQNITQGQYGQGDNEGSAGQTTSGLQQLGGGYTLQQMQTPADQRAERAYQLSVNADRRAETAAERAARTEQRTEQRLEQTTDRGDRVAQSALRREFNSRPEVKEFREVDNSYRTIRNFVQRPSAAGDISLIFAFMKVLDPTSTVREGEFATASNAGGVPDSIRNMANRAMNGQRLQPNQRQDFLRQAEALRSTRQQRYDQVLGEYRFEAEQQGFDPNRIIGGTNDQGQRQPQRPPAPPGMAYVPGIPNFPLTTAQQQVRQRLVQNGANPSSPLGSALNPRYVNPLDERSTIANLQREAITAARQGLEVWFVPPSGGQALRVPLPPRSGR